MPINSSVEQPVIAEHEIHVLNVSREEKVLRSNSAMEHGFAALFQTACCINRWLIQRSVKNNPGVINNRIVTCDQLTNRTTAPKAIMAMMATAAIPSCLHDTSFVVNGGSATSLSRRRDPVR